MITFRVEVSGAREAAAELRAQGARAADLEVPLARAAFYVLVRTWDRITRKSVNDYSERYRQWLLRTGRWSGKLVGILSGAMIAASAPAKGAGTSGALDTRAGADCVEVGFLNPLPRIFGFLGWFKRKFGEEAIRVDAADGEEIRRIFDEWLLKGDAHG